MWNKSKISCWKACFNSQRYENLGKYAWTIPDFYRASSLKTGTVLQELVQIHKEWTSFNWTGSVWNELDRLLVDWVSFIWERLVLNETEQFSMDRVSLEWTGTVLISFIKDWIHNPVMSYREMIFFSGRSKIGIVMSRASKTKSVNETRNDSKIKNWRRKSKSSHW